MFSPEKEWFIEAPWGKMCVVAWGNCVDPPVLVCHGHLDSAASFRPLMKLLPKQFYYIGMEFPGTGKSDPLPPGLMISTYDLMYSIHVVVKHFRWETFACLAHSMGCHLGTMYALTYPHKVNRLIQLDPVSSHIDVPVDKFGLWYKRNFTDFFENYELYNSPKESSRKYNKDEVIEKLMKSRGLTKDAASATLERWSEPTEDGHIRFTYDQRYKAVAHAPFTKEHIKSMTTGLSAPTLAIVAEESKQNGGYKGYDFIMDESAFPGNNYRVRVVAGNHDVHIIHPERVAPYVTRFLLYGLKGLDSKSKI